VAAMGLNWNDSQELGELLFEKYDSVNPMTVRFADLRKWVLDLEDFAKWVLDLEDFAGKPSASNEENLHAIQKAWHEEWKLEYGDD
jgi:Fe-S-cluster formation regulator IscX/YfhJ